MGPEQLCGKEVLVRLAKLLVEDSLLNLALVVAVGGVYAS